jgi:hypothetical protein
MQKKWQSSLGNLAKSRYEPDMKYKSLMILWLHTDRLLTFPLKFWVENFKITWISLFNFKCFFLTKFFRLKNRLVTFKWYLGLFNKILRPGISFSVKFSLAQKMFSKQGILCHNILIFWKKVVTKETNLSLLHFYSQLQLQKWTKL